MGLERTQALLAELGRPETGLRGALVTGTNGKGSTCAFLASILSAAGLRAGTMPSPHLASYTERVQINGVPISEGELAAALDAVTPALEAVAARLGEPTEFEILTVLALNWLSPRADRLVIEVGMGGRLDTTNVLDLGVAVVTNVALDHTQHLGTTLEAIAVEKAAIVKAGNLCLTAAEGPPLGVVEARCRAVGAGLWRLGRELEVDWRWQGWDGSELDIAGPGFQHRALKIPLLGSFQPPNAALAVAAAHALGDATPEAVRAGVAATRWPGRLELVAESPRMLVDGGHNREGLRRLAADVSRLLTGADPPVVVFGAMSDKDVPGLLGGLRLLRPAAVLFTRAASAGERAADPAGLAAQWGAGGRAVEPAAAALEEARARAGSGGTVLVCGSLYLVGELRPE
jgi:dihydrofolate synthase / folylpolyglutamate synthase